MSNRNFKHKGNVEGNYYCTNHKDPKNGCIGCQLCYQTVPECFNKDDQGYAYVHSQPKNQLEKMSCDEVMWQCPVKSIGNNGK